MTKRRYTYEVIASGQPRAYADTQFIGRITLEWQGMEGYKDKNARFIPLDVSESYVRPLCKQFSGWTEENEGDWASTRLVYLKKIEPNIWEWKTQSAFTD